MSDDAKSKPLTSTAQIKIGPPRLFNTGAVLVASAFGFLAVLPLFISFLIVSLMPIGILTLLIPLAAVALTACFLPFAFGNAYISRLVRSLHPAAGKTPGSFIVQLTLNPRIRSGLRALAEDADDVGCLTFTDSEMLFQGDSIQLVVPLHQVREVRRRNLGLKGAFVWPRITLAVPGLPNIASLEIGERSSWLLPACRRTTLEVYERLKRAS